MKKIITIIALSAYCGYITAQQTYTLEQLLDSARLNNIAMRGARHDIEAAQHGRKEAFTKYFPTISASGAWFRANKGIVQTAINPSQLIPADMGAALAQSLSAEAVAAMAGTINISMLKNGTIAGITALQPVFAGGQIVNANKLAKLGQDVAHLQLQLSENDVEKTTQQYYWQIVTLQQKLNTITATEQMLNNIHKDVETGVQAGLAMTNDILQVQLRQNDVSSQRLTVENNVSMMRMLLGQFAGLTPQDGADYSFNVAVPSMDMQDNPLPTPLGENNAISILPEYQLLTKQVEAARLQKNITIGQNLPTAGIGVAYNYHNLLDNNHSFGMVFATVNVPVSDWWGGAHAVRRKKTEYQKAQEQLTDNAELLRIRMRRAWNDVVETHQQLEIAQRSIEQAEENLRIQRDAYNAGISTMSDLLEALLLFQQSCDKRADAFALYQGKLLEYRHATGQ